MFPMPLNLILAVGKDPAWLESRSSILRHAGYIVDSEYSVKHAIDRFRQGDFDLVLLCHSMPAQDRNRLIHSIRAFGSLTPIVSVASLHAHAPDAFADAMAEDAPEKLLSCIKNVLLKAAAVYKPRDRNPAFYY
jgi:CheY-like chemotaxis protein